MEFPCDKAILLHSKESLTEALKVQKIITVPSELVLLKEPNNFKSVSDVIKALQMSHLEASWDVNISSGTKIMSVALYSAFVNFNAPCRLFHIEQNGLVHHLLPLIKSEILNTYLPVKSYFKFAGYHLKSYSDFKFIEKDTLALYHISRSIFLGKKYKSEITKLFSLYRRHSNTCTPAVSFSVGPIGKGSEIKWDAAESKLTLYINGTEKYILKGKNAIEILLHTKWFELEVAQILKKWDKTKEMLWEVTVSTSEGEDKNEIDLIVNTGNKLLFVECKTSVYDVKDIDKFHNVTKNYGGMGAKAILITFSPLKKNMIERCEFNNIIYFTLAYDNNSITNAKKLYSLLNEEVVKSNK